MITGLRQPSTERLCEGGHWAWSIEATILATAEGNWRKDANGIVCVQLLRFSNPRTKISGGKCRKLPSPDDGQIVFADLFRDGLWPVAVEGSFNR